VIEYGKREYLKIIKANISTSEHYAAYLTFFHTVCLNMGVVRCNCENQLLFGDNKACVNTVIHVDLEPDKFLLPGHFPNNKIRCSVLPLTVLARHILYG
jgi:hypothetical protein